MLNLKRFCGLVAVALLLVVPASASASGSQTQFPSSAFSPDASAITTVQADGSLTATHAVRAITFRLKATACSGGSLPSALVRVDSLTATISLTTSTVAYRFYVDPFGFTAWAANTAHLVHISNASGCGIVKGQPDRTVDEDEFF